MMKKAVALMLVAGLMMGVAGTAFAETVQSIGLGQQTHEVKATYEAGETGGKVISIDIDWNDLEFTYFGGSEPVWDPVTHTYSGETEAAGWRGTGNITVTNHSNAFIDVGTVSYTPAEGYGNVRMEFGYENCNGVGLVHSAEVDNQAQRGVISVTPVGTLPEGTQDETVGTITLTVKEMKDINFDDFGPMVDAYWTKSEQLEGKASADELTALRECIAAMEAVRYSIGYRDFDYKPITAEEQLAMNKTYIDTMGMTKILANKYLG